MSDSKTTLTNFRLPIELRKQYHIYCVQNETSIANRLRQLIALDLSGKIDIEFNEKTAPK